MRTSLQDENCNSRAERLLIATAIVFAASVVKDKQNNEVQSPNCGNMMPFKCWKHAYRKAYVVHSWCSDYLASQVREPGINSHRQQKYSRHIWCHLRKDIMLQFALPVDFLGWSFLNLSCS